MKTRNNKKTKNMRTDKHVPLYNSIAMNTTDIMPPNIVRRLNYIDSDMKRTAAAPFLCFRYRANSLYDPDPLVLSGAVSGFAELANLYKIYRVIHTGFEWTVSNNEDFPVIVGVVYSTSDLASSIASADDALNALENGYSSRSKLLSAKGGQDRLQIQGDLDLYKLVGNKQYFDASSEFGALTSANPTAILYINFIVVSTGGSNLTNGVSQGLQLRFTTKFYDRVTNFF